MTGVLADRRAAKRRRTEGPCGLLGHPDALYEMDSGTIVGCALMSSSSLAHVTPQATESVPEVLWVESETV